MLTWINKHLDAPVSLRLQVALSAFEREVATDRAIVHCMYMTRWEGHMAIHFGGEQSSTLLGGAVAAPFGWLPARS